MVNFNQEIFDTWESACEQISEFSGVNFGSVQSQKKVFNIILTEVLSKISEEHSDIFINLSYAEKSMSIFNESNTIKVQKTINNYSKTFNQVIFNGLLEFIQRYTAANNGNS